MLEKKEAPPPKPNINILKCKLVRKEWLTSKIVRLRIANESLARLSYPGQFVNVKVTEGYIPLLRRPFSIHRVHRREGWFEILFQVIGKGTELLADFSVNNELDILGPLGNNFDIPNNCDRAILIGGGLGIAPLLFLAQELAERKVSAALFYGNKSRESFCCVDDFENLDIQNFLATEDGSLGFKGKVTDLFITKRVIFEADAMMIYACGPNPMLQKVKDIADQFQLPCQVSLETMMACGFGACLGCVVNSTSSTDPYKYVCKDGPVFYSSEIDLSD